MYQEQQYDIDTPLLYSLSSQSYTLATMEFSPALQFCHLKNVITIK